MLKQSLYLTVFLTLFTGFTNAYADVVKIVDNAKEAYELRLQLIKKAQHEIQLSYFIFSDDESSIDLLAALRAKLHEGVRVRIMVDDLFNDIPKYIGTVLIDEGLEIRNFNKFSLFNLKRTINNRMHDKLLIVDQEMMIIGSRNIENNYFGKAKKNFFDRDLLILGDGPKTASEYYNNLWEADHTTNFKIAKLYVKDPNDGRYKYYWRSLRKAFGILTKKMHEFRQREYSFDIEKYIDEAVEVEGVDFAFETISSVKDSQKGTTKRLYKLLKFAQNSIVIDTPYLVLTDRLERIFRKRIKEGVKIRILTNSLASTDGLLPQAAYLNHRLNIVSMGIELYEYSGEDSFHAKSIVIDKQIAIVGSFNLDPRSENLNTETVAVINDIKVADLLLKSMNANLESSYKIDENGIPEGHTVGSPGASMGKVFLTKLLQYTIARIMRGLI